MGLDGKVMNSSHWAFIAMFIYALWFTEVAHASYPDFYVEKNQSGLSFVLEKVDCNNHDKWTRFEQEQTAYRERQLGKIQQIELELSEGTSVADLHPELQKIYPHRHVIHAAEDPLEKFRNGSGRFSAADVFVCYAIDSQLTEKIDAAEMKNIQIFMLVITKYGIPFQIHMAIGRGLRVTEDGKVHNGLAAPLHGFPAKMFRQWDPAKILFMTTPVPVMRDILVKRLPIGTYWQDSSWDGTSKDESVLVEYDHSSPKDFPMIVRNFAGSIVFQYKPGEKCGWFFGNLQLKTPWSALVVIDLSALEKLFL